jgi:hypothetical protein
MLKVDYTVNNATRQVNISAQAYGQVFVDWGDGTTTQATVGTPPNQTTGVLGTFTATKTYTKEGFYEIRVRANDIKDTLGSIWVGRTLPAWDPEKRKPNMQERWQREAARVADMRQARRY